MRSTATIYVVRLEHEVAVPLSGEVTFGYRPRVEYLDVSGDIDLTDRETDRARQALIDACAEAYPEDPIDVMRSDAMFDEARDDVWGGR